MQLYLFLFLQMLYSIALQGTRPMVSLYADSQGASAVVIGLLVSAFAFFPMLLAISVGKWLDQYGARRMVAFGGIGMLIALLVPIIFPNIEAILFSQVIIGFSHLCVLVSLQKTVGNWSADRDKLMAVFALMGSAGELLGPLISGFSYEHFSFRVSFGISVGFICIALLIGLFLRRESWKSGASTKTKKPGNVGSSWQMLRNVNLRKALIISGLVLYSKDLFVAYFPVYANAIGIPAGTIGVILSTMAGMAIAIRLSQFWLVKTFGRGLVLMTTLMISGITYLLIPLNSVSFVLAVLAGLLGIGLGLGQPLSLVYALNLSPKERQGHVLGMRLMFNRGSQFAAPLLFGSIGGVAGLFPVFWVSGGILLFASYFTRMRPSGEMKQSLSEQAEGKGV